MSVLVLEPNVIALQNTIERITITIQDANGVPTDPIELQLSVFNVNGGAAQLTDTWPAPALRLVHVSAGKFYIDFGNQLNNLETNCPYHWLFDWRIQMTVGGGYTHSLQNVNIVSVKTASLLPDLRLMLDKSKKLVDRDHDCWLGYTDSMLVTFVEGGLQNINAYQPSLTFTMENFPFEYRQILIDAALITGVMSQELYAIDTDLNYNDQGTSFTIPHQPQLASFLNSLTQRLDKLIPQMKLQLLQPGSLHVQMGPNFKLGQLMQAAPGGSIFRGVFFKG